MWSSVEGHVPGQARLPRHQQRVGDLVDLRQPERVRGDRAVELGVAGEAPVGLLDAVEQEQRHVPSAGRVAVGEQAGERLVAVTGEHLPVGPAGMRGGGRHRLAPRVGRRGHERADVRLVLGGLDDVGRHPVGAPHRGILGVGEPGQAPRWAAQGGVVAAPAGYVLPQCPRQTAGRRCLGRRRSPRGRRGANPSASVNGRPGVMSTRAVCTTFPSVAER